MTTFCCCYCDLIKHLRFSFSHWSVAFWTVNGWLFHKKYKLRQNLTQNVHSYVRRGNHIILHVFFKLVTGDAYKQETLALLAGTWFPLRIFVNSEVRNCLDWLSRFCLVAFRLWHRKLDFFCDVYFHDRINIWSSCLFYVLFVYVLFSLLLCTFININILIILLMYEDTISALNPPNIVQY